MNAPDPYETNSPTPTQEHEPEHEVATPTLQPRIWVASLADYTAGHLHGEWLDAAVPTDELREQVQRMLRRSRHPAAEEWAIFDSDEFGSYRVEEYDSLDQLATVATGIAQYGLAFAAWAELHDGDEDMLAQFEDCYVGIYDSPTAWAEDTLGASSVPDLIELHIPDSLAAYVRIDYEAFAQDALLGGDVYFEPTPSGDVWVFRAT